MPGKANRARLGRSPASPGPRHHRRAAAGAVRARGPGAGPGRPGRAPALPRRPAGRSGSPATPGCGPTTSGCSSSATPCCARRTWPARSAAPAAGPATCPRWTCGTPTWPSTAPTCIAARLELCAALAPHVAKAYDAVSAGRGEAPHRLRRQVVADELAEPEPDRAAIEERCCRRWREPRPSEVERGSRWSVRTATTDADPRRAAGQGLRQPRRVLVVRAGAAAGRVRAAARRGHRAGAGARRRVRRAGRRPPGAAGRAGRPGEPGAGHLRGGRGRAGGAGRGPLPGGRRERCAVSTEDQAGADREPGPGPSWPGPCSTPPGRTGRPPARRRSRQRRAPAARVLRRRPRPARPAAIRRLLANLVKARGWQQPAAEARIFGAWEAMVGADLASHCRPVKLEDGELTVEAESTAWATQIAVAVRQAADPDRGRGWPGRRDPDPRPRAGRAVVGEGPEAGRGRGPRDTYG